MKTWQKQGLMILMMPIMALAEINMSQLQNRASKNDNYALYQLGYIYENGKGVPADIKKAKAYYQRAAALGNSDAILALYLMRELEEGKSKSDAKCSNKVILLDSDNIMRKIYDKNIAALMKQAESGNADAEFQLGSAYDNGYGVKRDRKLAIQWYMRAAKHGSKQAKEILQIIRAAE